MTKNAFLGFVALVLLATTCTAQSGNFPGRIRLLPGYTHRRGQGIDSAVGSITRQGGLVIRYDIGPLAGVYTDCKTCGWTEGELWRRNQVINGRDVKIVFTKSKLLVISFPDTHANFYATVMSESDIADTLLMVLTYVPHG
jgi:hypothetical protein